MTMVFPESSKPFLIMPIDQSGDVEKQKNFRPINLLMPKFNKRIETFQTNNNYGKAYGR